MHPQGILSENVLKEVEVIPAPNVRSRSNSRLKISFDGLKKETNMERVS